MSVAFQDGGGARATRLQVLVSPNEAEEISRRAGEAGLSVSAYLRTQALNGPVSKDELAAMAIFDRLLDDMTSRVDAANAGLSASLERIKATKSGGET